MSEVKSIMKHGEHGPMESVKYKEGHGKKKLKVKFGKREEAMERAKKMHGVKH